MYTIPKTHKTIHNLTKFHTTLNKQKIQNISQLCTALQQTNKNLHNSTTDSAQLLQDFTDLYFFVK